MRTNRCWKSAAVEALKKAQGKSNYIAITDEAYKYLTNANNAHSHGFVGAPVQVDHGHQTVDYIENDNNLNYLQAPTSGWVACNGSSYNQEKETNIMNVTYSAEQNARGRLEIRARDIYWKMDSDNAKSFFPARYAKAPDNLEDAIQRLTEGKFTKNEDRIKKNSETQKKFGYRDYDWSELFTWADPATPDDSAGYTLASAELKTAFDRLLDAIAVKSPADALADLYAFEKFEGTVKYEANRKPTLH